MSDQFFYLGFKFTPKIGHTFTDEREVLVEVPKDLVQRRSESMYEGLTEVIALDLRRVRLSAPSRPSQNGLPRFTTKLRQIGIKSGIKS